MISATCGRAFPTPGLDHKSFTCRKYSIHTGERLSKSALQLELLMRQGIFKL